MTPKPNHLAHFAINAADVARAQRFYAAIFGWRFEAWGPPGFYMIQTAEGESPGPLGSLQERHHPAEGDSMRGFECTIAVSDVDKTAKDVVSAGGRIVMPRTTIATVGHLIKFVDTENNLVGAMQYDERAS